jgi:DNA-binding transcriptional LysR family regulator
MLSIEDLTLLEAIRETGSLSRAAAHLGKAPSTVSYAARQLEERFDALLFDRRRYRLQLTPAGELLVNEAARLMQDVSRLTQRVQQVANGWESRLWIVTDELLEFEALESGVPLRITQEVLKGVWEALREGRADLIIGATNEPPAIPSLRWMQLGEMEWVFAVSPKHPLARAQEPISRAMVAQHRAIVVADSSRITEGSTYGVSGGQPVLAVPTMRAKILAQCDGLGVGWLPKHRVGSLLKNGTLVEKQMADPREPNILYAGWRGDHDGRALGWWLEKLKQSYLSTKLVQGSDRFV